MRFDYVQYDEAAKAAQQDAKRICQELEGFLESQLPPGRARALAMTKLEETYMWIGKAVRDAQIERGGDATGQPYRTNE